MEHSFYVHFFFFFECYEANLLENMTAVLRRISHQNQHFRFFILNFTKNDSKFEANINHMLD